MLHYYFLIPLVAALSCEILGIAAFRYLPASFKLLLIEGILSMATDIGCLFHPVVNNELHNIFALLDFTLIFVAASSLLPAKQTTTILVASLIVFFCSWGLSIYKTGFNEFANYAFATGSFFVIIIYLIVLYMSETQTGNRVTLPIRLICLALILYHTGTFVFILGVHYLMNNNIPEAVVDINTTLDTIKYLLIATAFYLFKKKSTQGKLKT